MNILIVSDRRDAPPAQATRDGSIFQIIRSHALAINQVRGRRYDYVIFHTPRSQVAPDLVEAINHCTIGKGVQLQGCV